jgi:hypothetical protein
MAARTSYKMRGVTPVKAFSIQDGAIIRITTPTGEIELDADLLAQILADHSPFSFLVQRIVTNDDDSETLAPLEAVYAEQPEDAS